MASPESLAYGRLGPLALCPAFLYGVRVVPAPSFFQSGFGYQHVKRIVGTNTYEAQVGLTICPDVADLYDWAGCDSMGGFSPGRSVVCTWGTGRRFYYKGGDGGEYDLYWVGQRSDFDQRSDFQQHDSMMGEYLNMVDTESRKYLEKNQHRLTKQERRAFMTHINAYKHREMMHFRRFVPEIKIATNRFYERIGGFSRVWLADFALPGKVCMADYGLPALGDIGDDVSWVGSDVEHQDDEHQTWWPTNDGQKRQRTAE